VWRVLITSHDLSKILPEEQRWNEACFRRRKGSFRYLLAAVSTLKCIRFRIKETDIQLLNILSDTTVENFIIQWPLEKYQVLKP
jgi:hypothetical protein